MTCPDCKSTNVTVQVVSEPKENSGILYSLLSMIVVAIASLILSIFSPILALTPVAFLLGLLVFRVPENVRKTYAVCQECGFFVELKTDSND